jgi:NADH:ubiquinone reductase (H+-translocating)
MKGNDNPARVVIIGGGFGGLFAARALRRARASITLIDRDGTHLFQPLLYQCATGILSEGHITAALRHLFRKQHNLDCLTAEAIDVDARGRRVTCRLPLDAKFEVPYDHLIVAAGMRQSYFGHDEFAAWAPGMKNIADALTIRRRVYGAFEMAETAGDPAAQRHWLTFALVGAGPTGVELAGQIRELATKTLRDEYRRFQPEDARVLLFDGGSAPLATFGDKLSRKATSALQSLGVELHMGSIVTKVDGDGLIARDHDGQQTAHDAGTVLWTAGVEAPPIAEALAKATGAEHDRAGRIAVQNDLTINGHPEISVIGDMMSLRKLPGVAEVAMQAGLYTGHRIKRLQNGNESPKPFKYHDLGSAAYIYRGRAVVSAGPVTFSGFPGWVIWLFIHIAFLTGYRNRVGAILTWWLAFTRDVRRERTYTTRAIGHLQDVYQPVGPAEERSTATGDAEAATLRPPAQRTAPPKPAARRQGT